MTLTANHVLQEFLAAFSAEKFSRYLDRLEAIIGHRYPYSTTPVFLSHAQLDRLVDTTHAVVRLLKSARFQQYMLQDDWILPWNELRPLDYFGCVDFHLQGDEARIIEVNFNVPGRVGLLELMEREFLDAFDLPTALRVNAGFEQQLVETVTQGDYAKSVAIAVNSTEASHDLLPHYEYVASTFRRHGVDAQCVFANDVQPGNGGRPYWYGKPFDVIFNLLIPRTWEDNPELFADYTKLYAAQPDRFCPSPQGWRLGNKRLLTVFHDLSVESFGISDLDRQLIAQSTLRSRLASDFDSVHQLLEAFGGERRLVLKPLAGYRSQGVFVQPSRAQVESVVSENPSGYVAQELFLAEKLASVAPDGSPCSIQFEVRVGFMNGRVNRIRGSNCANLEMTPVVIVP